MSTDPYRGASQQFEFQDRFVSDITVDASPSAAVETVIANVTLPSGLRADQGVMLHGMAAFTVGTSGVSGRLRIRRASVSGTVVADTDAATVTATNKVVMGVDGFDAIGASGAGAIYVLTLTVGSAAAGSTVADVVLSALIV